MSHKKTILITQNETFIGATGENFVLGAAERGFTIGFIHGVNDTITTQGPAPNVVNLTDSRHMHINDGGPVLIVNTFGRVDLSIADFSLDPRSSITLHGDARGGVIQFASDHAGGVDLLLTHGGKIDFLNMKDIGQLISHIHLA